MEVLDIGFLRPFGFGFGFDFELLLEEEEEGDFGFVVAFEEDCEIFEVGFTCLLMMIECGRVRER